MGVPRLPTPEGQTLANWLHAFHSQMGELTAADVLVGHSLGAAFAFRLLERAGQPVRGTFLVGAFLGQVAIEKFDIVNESFFREPFDWPRIRRLGGTMVLYDGDNDPYVAPDNVLGVSRSLQTDVTWIHNGGHINVHSGHVQFPEMLPTLLGVCGRGLDGSRPRGTASADAGTLRE